MADPRANIVLGSWSLGVYVDRWSFVHFGWGFMLASLLRMLGFSKLWAYSIALTLMIGWELTELYLSGPDRIQNSLLDITLASAGFWLMHYFWPRLRFMTDALVVGSILALTALTMVSAGVI